MLTPTKLDANLAGDRHRTNVVWDEEVKERVREMADQSGLTLGEVLNVATLLVEFLGVNERMVFGVHPHTPVSNIELAAILVARYSGLISDGEKDILLAYGEANPKHGVTHRLNILFKRLSEVMARRDADWPSRYEEFQRVLAMTPAERLEYLEQHG